jgi:hypothetical protein
MWLDDIYVSLGPPFCLADGGIPITRRASWSLPHLSPSTTTLHRGDAELVARRTRYSLAMKNHITFTIPTIFFKGITI